MKNTFTMSQAARAIGIPCIGRNTLYKILKIQGIVDYTNRPEQELVDAGLLKLQEVYHYAVGRIMRSNVTIAVGDEGLRFIKETVFHYLKDHPVPRFPRNILMPNDDIDI
jgi:hypothetical protein